MAAKSIDTDERARARVEVRELVLEPLRLVDARLGLARAGPRLAREPVELAAHAVAQRLLVSGLAGQQLVLRLEERAVAALHVQETLGERAVQLDHAAGHRLEEVAVVAHRDERLRLARQQVLEPEDSLDVEVVRGLVEEQQLRLADERARDRQPLLPPAGEDASPRRPVGEAGPADRDRDAALHLVLVEAEAVEGMGEDRRDGRAFLERGVLRHEPDAKSLARRARAGGRLLEAGEDAQQSRLAGAVRADEADVVALEDAEREALEERRRPEGLRDVA